MKQILCGLFCAGICTIFSIFTQMGMMLSQKENRMQTVLVPAAGPLRKASIEENVRLLCASVEKREDGLVLYGVEIQNNGQQALSHVELSVLLRNEKNRPVKIWKCILPTRGCYDNEPLKPSYIFCMEKGQEIPLCRTADDETSDQGRFEVSISRLFPEEKGNDTAEQNQKQAYIQEYVRLLSKPAIITRQKEAEVAAGLHVANRGDREIDKVAVSVYFSDRQGIIRGEIKWWFQKDGGDDTEALYLHLPSAGAFAQGDSYIYPLPAFWQGQKTGFWGIFSRYHCKVEISDILWEAS